MNRYSMVRLSFSQDGETQEQVFENCKLEQKGNVLLIHTDKTFSVRNIDINSIRTK